MILSVFPAIWEVIWGIPEFPGILHRLLFLFCATGFVFRSFSAIIPPSWVAWFTSVWEATRDRVRGAGTKAKAYVLGIYHRSRGSEGLGS